MASRRVLSTSLVLRILSFSLTLSIFLSIARWLVSSFFTNAFVRDHVWHPYVIAGKTHWLKIFLFRLMRQYLSRKVSLYFPKTLHPAFILIETSCFILFSLAIFCPRYLVSQLLYFCPVYLSMLSVVSIFVIHLGFTLCILRPTFKLPSFTVFN